MTAPTPSAERCEACFTKKGQQRPLLFTYIGRDRHHALYANSKVMP